MTRVLAGPSGPGTSSARIRCAGQSPREVNFGCPWPLRESPFRERARESALEWMEDFGLTRDFEANVAQFRHWKLAECAAWFYPDGTPEGVELAAQLMGWYFAPFDDQFDGDLARDSQAAAQLCGELTTILDLPEGAPLPAPSPVVAGFADLWWRSCRGMSTQWRQRAAQHWRQYLSRQLAEVVDRRHARTQDVEGCLRRRAVTTSSGPLSDLIECLSGFEVPDQAWQSPLLSELRRLTAEIISITNDLVSAEKEEAQGDRVNNLLLILEDQHGCTRHQAIERLREMTHERYARFLRLETQAPDLDDVLTTTGRIALRRYITGLHDLLAGDNEWEHTSGRYAT
ncbi:pentalenene synthase [Streptomyces sp. R41]|uniref:Terpene synthase n=1 Tax=Streptomyces sp. R41 TaxID=3238632 RepID=A0AB39R8P2_9ACTN